MSTNLKERHVKDDAKAAERLQDLRAAVEYADYELRAAVVILRAHGWSWAKVGEALGITREGAYQKYKHAELGGIEHEERERIARLIGIGEGTVRYEVSEVVKGWPGVNRVGPRFVSRHIKREVAERAFDKALAATSASGVQLEAVRPSGERERLKITRRVR